MKSIQQSPPPKLPLPGNGEGGLSCQLKDKLLTLFAAALVMMLGGCPSEKDEGSQVSDVPVDVSDPAAGTGGGSTSTGGAGTGGGMPDAGSTTSDSVDAGAADAGGEVDAGTASTGVSSCCEPSTEPGCADADTETCVCQLLPECCSTAWDEPCVELVRQKFCEPGVRECVCGPASEGGWEQIQCCDTSWSEFCATTAFIKCEGDPSCM